MLSLLTAVLVFVPCFTVLVAIIINCLGLFDIRTNIRRGLIIALIYYQSLTDRGVSWSAVTVAVPRIFQVSLSLFFTFYGLSSAFLSFKFVLCGQKELRFISMFSFRSY